MNLAEKIIAVVEERVKSVVEELTGGLETRLAEVRAEALAEIANVKASYQAEIANVKASYQADIAKLNAKLSAPPPSEHQQ